MDRDPLNSQYAPGTANTAATAATFDNPNQNYYDGLQKEIYNLDPT